MALQLWRRPAAIKLPASVEQSLTDLAYAIHPETLRPGNRFTLLRDGSETYPAMLAAIAGARQYVHLETYILHADHTGRRFAEALAGRARAGVEVRLIYDGVGSLSLPDDFLAGLGDAGVQAVPYRPIAPWRPRWGLTRRDHRKILVVDGQVGFAGGLNLGDEFAAVEEQGGGWHDLHARVEGPAVADLARLFRKTWLAAGGHPYPQGEEPAEEVVATAGTAFGLAVGNEELRRRRTIRRAYLHAMKRARASIALVSAYFIPDRGIRRALANAVRRGVQVSVIVPGSSDLRSVQLASQHLFSTLLRSGVRIFQWPKRMLHAKAAVMDATFAIIGSYNFDSRSLFHNLEVVLLSVERGFGERLAEQLEADRARSREVTLSAWKQRPLWQRIGEWFWYLFRHWL